MSEHDKQSRTEAATPRRREKARSRGEVAYSAELTAGITLLGAAILLGWIGPACGHRLEQAMRLSLGSLPFDSLDGRTLEALFSSTLFQLASIIGTVAVTGYFVTAGVGLWQSGFRISMHPLQFNASRLDPVKGWTRIFSSQGVVRGALGIGKALLIGSIIVTVAYANADLYGRVSQGSVRAAIAASWVVVRQCWLAVALAMLGMGIVDYFYQRWRYEQELKMSRQDVKDENKDEEGDPHVKAKIRKAQRDLSRNRMMQEVPSATVILTNPTHLAIAIKYEPGMVAPVVVAKGADLVAHRIVALAKKHRVPVLERKPIARLLYRTTEIGQQIPPELYKAVAEIVVYLYQLGRAA